MAAGRSLRSLAGSSNRADFPASASIAGSEPPASTLVEVLILMILSGIVFLSVMDGLGRCAAFSIALRSGLPSTTEQYAGYFRTVDLAGDSTAWSWKAKGRWRSIAGEVSMPGSHWPTLR
ncbi:MAG: hypothetical protein ACLR8Y_10205 [Alistipes indistinctus]